MSDRLTLSATVRTQTGKNANRKLRARGVIPAVFYTAGGEATPVQVNEAALTRAYAANARSTVLDLVIENNGSATTHPCLIWDVEYYPTKNRFQHVDFFGVDLEKDIKVRVPLEFQGVARGTKLGGKLETYREQIDVVSTPLNLPKKVVVDISDLDVGQGLRVADLKLPEGVRASYADNFAVVLVTNPKGADEAKEDI